MELLPRSHNENILESFSEERGNKWMALPLRKTAAGHKISGSCENFRDSPFDVYERSLIPCVLSHARFLGA